MEQVFFELNESDILSLNFSIDHRQAIENAYQYLEFVKTELDRENANFALKILEAVKKIISELNDDNLYFEYEILECICLQKLEKINEASQKYERLSKRFPKDPRPLLYLAEIYMNDKDNGKNNYLLEKAEKMNSEFWLLRLEKLIRRLILGEKIDTNNINEKTFPDDPKIKANFYRLYALAFDAAGDQINADSFIEKAINLNSERFSNYLNELGIIHHRMFSSEDQSKKLLLSQELLKKIEEIEKKFLENGDIGARNKAHLNIIKLDAFLIQDNIREIERISKDTFEFTIICYFDRLIELIIVRILQLVELPDSELNKLCAYLRASRKMISDDFAKVLIAQFNIRNTLFTDGKKLFEELDFPKYVEFINDLENNNYENVLEFLKEDIPFAVVVANTLKSKPDLRKKIIESLPDEKNIQKEKLRLLLNFDEKDIDEAFQILKKLDLSNLNYGECRPMLQIAQQKQAWDYELIILEKLLEKERNEQVKFNLSLELFTVNLNLGKYPESIIIGEQLLEEDSSKNFLNPANKEVLLSNTIVACMERGRVDEEAFKKAKFLLGKYPLPNPSFEYKVEIEAEVYLCNNEVDNALNSIIEGVKIKRVLSPLEYAKLYFIFPIKIGNRLHLTLDSLKKVIDNTFVKLTNKDQWYFIGNDDSLDALPVSKTNNRYPIIIERKVGDKIVFGSRYRSESSTEKIELILPIEKYLLWQIVHNFHKLGKEGDLEGVDLIEVPEVGDTIDPKNILNFFEDLQKRTEPLFNLYLKNIVPFAILAKGEGGLTNAIVRIQQEGKGFINFSAGTNQEFEKQKEIAKSIVNGELSFYIDGTSAFFLSEFGILPKIYSSIPKLKVPQSVINLLASISARFQFEIGQIGYMGYTQGKLNFSYVYPERRNFLRSNFIASIKLLESVPKNISVISSVNKMDCFSEKEIPAELSDACILAQKEKIPVLTEDFLYLQFNELDTKKKAPEYFSSLALVKVLYEKEQISFDEYLDYFSYLSSYRFRFLALTMEDINKAVFGDREIKKVQLENIRKLNFPLTLSEEYGVPFQVAFRVVGLFIIQVLIDNAVTVDITEKIFVEILEAFPTNMGKKELGQLVLQFCNKVIEEKRSMSLVRVDNQLLHNKIDRLIKLTEIYSTESKLWKPNLPI